MVQGKTAPDVQALNVKDGESIQVEFEDFEKFVRTDQDVWIWGYSTESVIQAEYAPGKLITANCATFLKRKKRFRFRVLKLKFPLIGLIAKVEAEVTAYGKRYIVWSWARFGEIERGKAVWSGFDLLDLVSVRDAFEMEATEQNALNLLLRVAGIERTEAENAENAERKKNGSEVHV